MRFPVRTLLSLAAFSVACTPKAETPATPVASAELSSAELDAVKAVDATFSAGMNAKDTVVLFDAYAPEAKLMAPDAPVLEGPAVHTALLGLLAEGATDFALTPMSASGSGDLAFIVGKATWKNKAGAADSVKYTEVLRKGTDGKWRYVVDMFNTLAPAKMPMEPAAKK